jgi:hypothetical protein
MKFSTAIVALAATVVSAAPATNGQLSPADAQLPIGGWIIIANSYEDTPGLARRSGLPANTLAARSVDEAMGALKAHVGSPSCDMKRNNLF